MVSCFSICRGNCVWGELMRRFPIRFGIITGIFLLIIFALVVSPLISSPSYTEIKHPFSISVSEPEITEEPGQYFDNDALVPTGTTERRLELTVSINNTTQEEFRDVWFQLTLNPEAAPFIAGQMTTFESDPMPVTTAEKAAQNDDSSKLLISGFSHTWGMLLTTDTDLAEYHGKKPDEIADALQSITVSVYWDGGSQTETLPCSLA